MKVAEKVFQQINSNSLYKAFGIRIQGADKGKSQSTLEPDPNICWPFPSQPHGGVLFTLMDTTMAWALFSLLEPGYNCATVHLDIQYTIPARKSPFVCLAHVVHKTQNLGFLEAEIRDAVDHLVASGQATFRVVQDPLSLGLVNPVDREKKR